MKTRYTILLALVLGLVCLYIGLPLIPTLVIGSLLSLTIDLAFIGYKWLEIDTESK